MQFTLSIILIPYALAVIVFILFALFNIYHMVKFGFVTFESFFMTFIFLGGTILILFVSYKLGLEINWDKILYIDLYMK